jgi:DNA mismatch endonuclease (patch repair protein)
MVANVGITTTPERTLRSALHRANLRFRKDVRPEQSFRCAADIVFRRQKVCVFIDGCFWHGCPIHFAYPKTNAAWWKEKIQATIDRDRRQSRWLKEHGWTVIRVWEHEITENDLPEIVSKITSTVGCKED